MKRTHVEPPELLDGLARGYTHAVRIENPGSIIFVTGQMPVDKDVNVVGDTIEEQARLTFQNLEHALRAAGATMKDVVKMTGFVVGTENFGAIRKIKAEFFDMEKPPASTMVPVERLANPGMLVEIEVIAVTP